MPFKKGDRANPNGRPKGVQNKSVTELRAVLQAAFQGEIINIPRMLAELDAEKRLEILAKFIGYILPKPIELPADSGKPESVQPPNVTFTEKDMSNNKEIQNER